MKIVNCDCGESYWVNESGWPAMCRCGKKLEHKPLIEKTEPVAEVPCSALVSRIASNMEKEANDLFTRDVRDPKRGKSFYYNLRGNILKDFANVINKAMEG